MTASSDDGLTDRQRDTLRLHREGKNPTEIAEALGISSQGVHGHFRRLRAKGLMEGDDRAVRASSRRRNGSGPVTADDALEAVRATARTQRNALIERKESITAEIDALKAEAKKIDKTVGELDAMVGVDA